MNYSGQYPPPNGSANSAAAATAQSQYHYSDLQRPLQNPGMSAQLYPYSAPPPVSQYYQNSNQFTTLHHQSSTPPPPVPSSQSLNANGALSTAPSAQSQTADLYQQYQPQAAHHQLPLQQQYLSSPYGHPQYSQFVQPPPPPPSAQHQPYQVQTITDPTGQIAPPGAKPKVTTTLWEDESTLCYQVEARGICVARREDNDMINGTKLLNVAGMTRGRRDGILKGEKNRHVVKAGAMHLKGVWIPYDRALDFANKEKIIDLLYPLFVNDIKSVLYHPTNYSRTAPVLNAVEKKKEEAAAAAAALAHSAPNTPSLVDKKDSPASLGGHHPPVPQHANTAPPPLPTHSYYQTHAQSRYNPSPQPHQHQPQHHQPQQQHFALPQINNLNGYYNPIPQQTHSAPGASHGNDGADAYSASAATTTPLTDSLPHTPASTTLPMQQSIEDTAGVPNSKPQVPQQLNGLAIMNSDRSSNNSPRLYDVKEPETGDTRPADTHDDEHPAKRTKVSDD